MILKFLATRGKWNRSDPLAAQDREENAREAISSCEELDKRSLKRRGLKMFISLQLSLAETLVCHTLVEKIHSTEDTGRVFQWLVESEHI